MLTTVPSLIKAREFCIRYKCKKGCLKHKAGDLLSAWLSYFLDSNSRTDWEEICWFFFRKFKIFLSFLPYPPHFLFPFHVFSFFLSSFCCCHFLFIFFSAGCFPLFPLTSLSQIFFFDSCHRSFVELTCKVIKVENYF